MTIEETLRFIHCTDWKGSILGLDRMRKLLCLLDNPQDRLRYVHIAGTNGKGSTAAIIASILKESGYRTGLYTSPHLIRINERMKINGINISDKDLCKAAEAVKTAADAMKDAPTEFEIITAIAFCYFASEHCDIVVLEVGLGGRLDATNVIKFPEVAVITNIGLEHTEILGSTLEEIAHEKAGIIKKGCTAVLYQQPPEVEKAVRDTAQKKCAEVCMVSFSALREGAETLDGQYFSWREWRDLFLPLTGEHQAKNAAVALDAISVLREKGCHITDKAIRNGLRNVRWPGRLEILCHNPLFIADGAHNPQCTEILAQSLNKLLPGRRFVFLIGVLADKDYGRMIDTLVPMAEMFLCLTPDSPRALLAKDFAHAIKAKGGKATAYDSVEEGIFTALDASLAFPIICCGSLYLLGSVLEKFQATAKKWIRKKKLAERAKLSPEDRKEKSAAIMNHITQLESYRKARNIFLYKATENEADLSSLPQLPASKGKVFSYPVCFRDREMKAFIPQTAGSWKTGKHNLREPIPEKSKEMKPQEIDLILCPCAGFDAKGNRLGMGGGYYDKFLRQCPDATIIAVAFDCQKIGEIPAQPWDIPMQRIVTESGEYAPES